MNLPPSDRGSASPRSPHAGSAAGHHADPAAQCSIQHAPRLITRRAGLHLNER